MKLYQVNLGNVLSLSSIQPLVVRVKDAFLFPNDYGNIYIMRQSWFYIALSVLSKQPVTHHSPSVLLTIYISDKIQSNKQVQKELKYLPLKVMVTIILSLVSDRFLLLAKLFCWKVELP